MAGINIKFEGVNLLEAMSGIVEAHTECYKSDFYGADM